MIELDLRGRLASKVLLVQLVRRVLRGLLVSLARQVRQEFKDHRAHPVNQGLVVE